MSDIVIDIENLGKRYKIATAKDKGRTFREALTDKVLTPLQRIRNIFSTNDSSLNTESASIWALKDLSLQVKRGEVLGIIGRNGTGKTTLLKVLSKITEPTEGEVRITGLVGSLLEVGAGFHSELTGRENVYLNGAILGMKKAEIDRRFDGIVAFAEMEKFIDTPVKRYSTGMYMRLAFAVAAHLEPEILLVDEVLAVGDISFQKKCLGKMGSIARSGRTVLFVSHNMSAILDLCNSAIWLDNGKIVKQGTAGEVVGDYEEKLLRGFDKSFYVAERNPEEFKVLSFYIKRVEILNMKGENITTFKYNDTFVLIVDFAGMSMGNHYSAEFYIYNELGQLVSVGGSGPYHGKYFKKEVRKIKIEIGPLILTSGKYRIKLSVLFGTMRCDTWENAMGFTIIECRPFATNWEIPAFREGACILQHSFSEA